MSHLTEAKELLQKNLAAAFRQYKDFPRTFFPTEKPPFRTLNKESIKEQGFRQCPICDIICHIDNFAGHLSAEHKQQYLPPITQAREGQGHQAARPSPSCHYCGSTEDSLPLKDHIRDQHTCPFCPSQGNEDTIWKHLLETHELEECKDC